LVRENERVDGLGSSDILLFEGFQFDRRAGRPFRLDQAGIATPVAVGGRALDLLGLLLRRQGELVSKDEIMAVVWPGKVVEEANLNDERLGVVLAVCFITSSRTA
jgi:DNA-binding winged helix-turn-helix (wHTH) protein